MLCARVVWLRVLSSFLSCICRSTVYLHGLYILSSCPTDVSIYLLINTYVFYCHSMILFLHLSDYRVHIYLSPCVKKRLVLWVIFAFLNLSIYNVFFYCYITQLRWWEIGSDAKKFYWDIWKWTVHDSSFILLRVRKCGFTHASRAEIRIFTPHFVRYYEESTR